MSLRHFPPVAPASASFFAGDPGAVRLASARRLAQVDNTHLMKLLHAVQPAHALQLLGVLLLTAFAGARELVVLI